MSKRAIIIIPVYKENISTEEIISLKQCIKVLHNHDICLVFPDGLDVNVYLKYYNNFKLKNFDKKYFQNGLTYSRLLFNPEFYGSFLKYDYILIYQLDAFVFRDDLNYWMNKNIDYIGAPWIDTSFGENHYYQAIGSKYLIWKYIKKNFNFNKKKFLTVGNGGFSLRNVKIFYKISKIISYLISENKINQNEDVLWSIYVPCFFPNFKIANLNDAIEFAFEKDAKYLFELNKRRLPFGCHAWGIYEKEFWNEYIK